jgi:hypothetical protein
VTRRALGAGAGLMLSGTMFTRDIDAHALGRPLSDRILSRDLRNSVGAHAARMSHPLSHPNTCLHLDSMRSHIHRCYLTSRDIFPTPQQVFNVPPKEQTYPAWLEGLWDVQCEFGGYAFPSTLPKVLHLTSCAVLTPRTTLQSLLLTPTGGCGLQEKVISNTTIPGFQKLSLVPPVPPPPPPAAETSAR